MPCHIIYFYTPQVCMLMEAVLLIYDWSPCGGSPLFVSFMKISPFQAQYLPQTCTVESQKVDPLTWRDDAGEEFFPIPPRKGRPR